MEQVELALALARRDFGPVVATVARALLQFPGLRHGELRGRCAVPRPSARAVDDGLAVLLTHGIAYGEARAPGAVAKAKQNARELNKMKGVGEDTEEKKTVMKGTRKTVPDGWNVGYKVRAEKLVERTRVPRWLWLLGKMNGAVALKVGRLLLQRGKMSAASVLKVLEIEGEPERVLREAEDALVMMVKAGSVRWAGQESEGVVAAGTVKIIVDGREEVPEEVEYGNDSEGEAERERENASRADDERAFRMLTDDEVDPTKAVLHKATGKVVTGRGRNRRFVAAPLQTNKDDLWAVSTWHLNRVLRNYSCQLVVAEMFGEGDRLGHAAKAYRVGMNLAIEMEVPDEQNMEEDVTEKVSFLDISLAMRAGGHQIDDLEFQDAVQQIVDLQPRFAAAVPPQEPDGLVFYPGQAVFLSRYATVRRTIQERFQLEGLRVWNALVLHGCMEEKMVSDRVMMNVKAVRELLFNLMRGGFCSIQEVPKSNEPARVDRAGTVWYLWRADMVASQKCVLSGALMATLRVLLKAEQLQEPPALAVESESERKVRLGKRLLLESTVHKLDQCIVLLRDFGSINDHYFEPLYERLEG